MAHVELPTSLTLGFLTVLAEGGSYVGGYLLTNTWGRPLEFRLTSAVQPNRVQQILYGPTLHNYLCGEVIGKTLVEKCSSPPGCIFTDTEGALHLRHHVQIPVAWLAPADHSNGGFLSLRSGGSGQPSLLWDGRFESDRAFLSAILEKVEGSLDLSEPFTRIRDAVKEARRIGVTSRG